PGEEHEHRPHDLPERVRKQHCFPPQLWVGVAEEEQYDSGGATTCCGRRSFWMRLQSSKPAAPATAAGMMRSMTGDAGHGGAPGLRRAAMGERLGGFIYGTIVALSVIVAGARAYPHGAGHIAALVIVTNVVFWLAHVYAHGLAHSV